MSTDPARRSELDELLAKVLLRGTWLGSAIIALGLGMPMTGWSGASAAMICTDITTAGIALLIALPVLRVLLMLMVFIRERDLRFSVIAMLVLAIILLGSLLGVSFSHGAFQISEQDRVMGLKRLAQRQFLFAAVAAARVDPPMHCAIGLLGWCVAGGQIDAELPIEAGLAQQQPGGEIGSGEQGFGSDAAGRQLFLGIDEPPPQRADTGIGLPAIVERGGGLVRRAPAHVEPGLQRLAAALLIEAALRKAQA